MDLASLRAAAWSALVYVWALAAEHPAITIPVVGALIARILKIRTPEEYASIAMRKPTWLFSRVAAALQLIPAVFPDTVKVERIVLEKILKGPPRTPKPPKPPLGPSILGVVVLGVALVACKPAESPRATARSVVETLADAVRVADHACTSIALAKEDLSLALKCADGVADARRLLIAAEDGVDAWDAAAAQKLPCAVRNAASALSQLLALIKEAGGNPPPIVEDALEHAPLVAGACRG